MKRHLTNEDISAYLDGEHRRPEAVQKHLQQCAVCAHEHVTMQKVSAHVKALPACEVTVGFTARVMRGVEQPKPSRLSIGRRLWVPLGAGLAAALALVLGLVTLDQSVAPVDPASTPVAVQPQNAPSVDLAGQLGPDGSEPIFLASDANDGADMQIAYASDVASRPVPHEFFSGSDYNASLIALNASEKETLLQLLGSTLIDEQMM